MWPNKIVFPAILSLAMLVPAALMSSALADSHTKEAEKARICAKAEKRYHKLYSKLPSEEDVTVVMMYKYTFCPSNIEVKTGEKIRWVNMDKRTSHSVWFKQKGGEETPRLFGEEQVEMTLEGPPGDYPYLCGPHWEEEGMIGSVTLKP